MAFDLGAPGTIDTLYLWNRAQICCGDGGLNEFNVFVSSDPNALVDPTHPSWTTVASGLTATSATDPSILNDNDSDSVLSFGDTINGEAFPLGGVFGQFVHLDFVSNHGSGAGTGLAEIRFEATLIPEPSTACLLLMASSLCVLRNRRS